MKKGMEGLLLGIMLVLMLAGMNSRHVQARTANEAQGVNSTESTDGTEETLIGWVTAEDGVYYYGEDGVMYAGDWYTIDGNRYFFNASGRLHYGWRTAGTGEKYYCDPNTGIMQTGWMTIGENTYYFSPDTGIMQTGLATIDGKQYFFNTSGRLHYGWRTSGGYRYYSLRTTGEMKTGGWLTIDGNTYYFNASGRLHYGWRTDSSGYKYYCDPKTGIMQTGWVTIGGYKYFFNASGRMHTGWRTASDGSKYFFNASGRLHYGWRTTSDGDKYYSDPDTGIMQTGLVTINGKMYFFNTSGRLHYGWRTSNGKKYYSDPKTGVVQTGYVTISGKTYYFDPTTGALSTAPVTNQITGNSSSGYYYVDSTGTRVTSKEITLAVQFVIDHSTSGASNATRLKECYDYLWRNYPYNRTYETPDASTMSDEAIAILTNGYGNCYKYAAAFACIAKVLGYDAKVCVGQISSRSGGMTPHGWTEVKKSGSWYLCDPDMQMNYPTRNVYMVTESAYPYTHTVTTKYTLSISNGVVSWVAG